MSGGSAPAPQQQRLFAFRMGERAPDTLVVTRANEAAATLLRGWRDWPGGAMALIGPAGSGKTHLANAWAAESGAHFVSALADAETVADAFAAHQGRLVIDDAETARDDLGLIHALDLARYKGGAVLMVGARAPATWRAATPDLHTRLKALPIAALEEPDDALLEVVLRRLCRERFIELTDKAAAYLAQHMERTFAEAHAIADALDALVVRGARPVSTGLARRALVQVRASSAMQSGDASGE